LSYWTCVNRANLKTFSTEQFRGYHFGLLLSGRKLWNCLTNNY